MRLGDHVERLGRIESATRRKVDQHVDRIGAGQLGVEAAGWPRPPAPGPAPGRRGDSAAASRHRPPPSAADDEQRRRGCKGRAGAPCGRRSRPQKRRSAATPVSPRGKLRAERRLAGREQARRAAGTSDSTVDQRDQRSTMKPASPNARIRSESENSSAEERQARRRVGQHAGRADDANGVAERGRACLRRRSSGRARRR